MELDIKMIKWLNVGRKVTLTLTLTFDKPTELPLRDYGMQNSKEIFVPAENCSTV
jgi:hypothetical protein